MRASTHTVDLEGTFKSKTPSTVDRVDLALSRVDVNTSPNYYYSIISGDGLTP